MCLSSTTFLMIIFSFLAEWVCESSLSASCKLHSFPSSTKDSVHFILFPDLPKNMFTCFPCELHISPTQISPIKFQFHPSFHTLCFFQIFHQLLRSFYGVQVKFPSSLTTYRAKPCGGVCSTLHAYPGTEAEKNVLGYFWFENVDKKYD